MNMDKDYVNPICSCGVNARQLNYYSKKDGRPLFKKYCWVCNGTKTRRHIQRANGEYNPHPKGRHNTEIAMRKRKTLICEKCGFKAEHSCQLDVDHIDGNHENNDMSNLQILCANCHRLKTYVNKDWVDKR